MNINFIEIPTKVTQRASFYYSWFTFCHFYKRSLLWFPVSKNALVHTVEWNLYCSQPNHDFREDGQYPASQYPASMLANSKCLTSIRTARYNLFLSDLSWNQGYQRRISSSPCKLSIFDNLLLSLILPVIMMEQTYSFWLLHKTLSMVWYRINSSFELEILEKTSLLQTSISLLIG